MEELKIIVGMVADLPQMALWVIAMLFAYKVVVVGSIYGVIRFTVGKIHDLLVHKKVEYKEIRPMLDGMCITGQTDRLIAQLHRLKNRKITSFKSDYIHDSDIDWLREAIDEKIEREAKK